MNVETGNLGKIYVHGLGAVSPAGWGVGALRDAMAKGAPLPLQVATRPDGSRPLRHRPVPASAARGPAHARLRRVSPITQYVVAAALEALGSEAEKISKDGVRLGIVSCVMSGCVNYSRRFYDETLKDPATASPLVFPETVFNAPSSHLAALLGTTALNYTLVGDPASFANGLALAAEWLLDGKVDGCLVIGAEEFDWLTVEAFQLVEPQIVLSAGAGALYLKRGESRVNGVSLQAITDAFCYTAQLSRRDALRRCREQLPLGGRGHLLCDSLQDLPRLDAPEREAWADWTGARLSPRAVLGEGLMAAAAWQCVIAVDALQQELYSEATVSLAGCNQQAIGARFAREPAGHP